MRSSFMGSIGGPHFLYPLLSRFLESGDQERSMRRLDKWGDRPMLQPDSRSPVPHQIQWDYSCKIWDALALKTPSHPYPH